MFRINLLFSGPAVLWFIFYLCLTIFLSVEFVPWK